MHETSLIEQEQPVGVLTTSIPAPAPTKTLCSYGARLTREELPGARYGWPKNVLHWNGIQQSILDLCATVPIHFVIADGIVAMEGNGPLNGIPRRLGSIVLADDPVGADATCARLMGFEPSRIVHLREGGKFLGNTSPALIDHAGESIIAPVPPFQTVPEFRHFCTA